MTDTAATPTPIPAPFDGDRTPDDARPDAPGARPAAVPPLDGGNGTSAGVPPAQAPTDGRVDDNDDDDLRSAAFEVEWARADALPRAAADALAGDPVEPPPSSEALSGAATPAPVAVPVDTPIPGPTPGAWEVDDRRVEVTPGVAAPAAAAAADVEADPAPPRPAPEVPPPRPPQPDAPSSAATSTSLRNAAGSRRARRVVRRVEPKSVAKVSVVFYACVFVALLVAGVLLWIAAAAAGIVGNVESFIGDLFALDEFRFEPWRILQATFLGGAVLVLLGTAANVVATLLFNVIADLVGGVEVTVVDDDGAEPARRSVV